MVVKIRDIGNAKGIIIPQQILAQCKITEDAKLEVRNDHIEISPISVNPREGWADAFKNMTTSGDDILSIPDIFEGENLEEWTW